MAKRLVARAITHADNPKDFVEQAMALARREIEHYGELLPVAFRLDVGGNVRMTPVSTASDREKRLTEIFIALVANQPDTDCVISLADAWFQEFDQPLEWPEAREFRRLKRKSRMSLEEFPRRREALVARIQRRDSRTIATWKYDRDDRGKPVFDEKLEWGDDLPLATIVASGPTCDFRKPVDCALFMKFVIDDVMARPTTAFPHAPQIILIDANLAEKLPEQFLDLFPKADNMVTAIMGFYEDIAQFEEYVGEIDPLGVKDVRARMAEFPDADIFVYAIFPKAGGNAMALPMYCDGEHYEFGSPSKSVK